MGSQRTAFHCDPSMVSTMCKAARTTLYEILEVEYLWFDMLRHVGAECSLVDDQQRTNLTQLMQQRPKALPPWLLASSKLHFRLIVEGDQVFLPSFWVESNDDTWEDSEARAAEQQQQLDHMCGAGEELLASAATSCAANTGFLLLQPPLPTQLLAQADTASMLALAQVCRGLRCASFELLRREHSCLHGIHRAKGPAPPPYLPLQRLPAQQQQEPQRRQQGQWEQQEEQQQFRIPGVAHCRVNRALSLLCGSPEAAAQQLLQHRAGGSSAADDSPAASADEPQAVCTYVRIFENGVDVFIQVFDLSIQHLATRIIIRQLDYDADKLGCELFWVKPEHLPKVLQVMEERRKGVLARMGSQQETWEARRGKKELERLLELARSAARLGCALCLLQTVW